MRKIIAVLMCMCLLTGCVGKTNRQTENNLQEKNYVVGMWITCFELEKMATEGFEEKFMQTLENAEKIGINTLFVHTKAYESCIYKSRYFPLSEWCESNQTDLLKFMIDACHSRNMEFHAWINPYRLSGSSDFSVSEKLLYLEEQRDIVKTDKGVYLNPASSSSRALVINSVKEIVSNYDVDGIHFDDYFYPVTDESFDSISYSEYCESSKEPIKLSDFRRAQVNGLISGIKQALSLCDKKIMFTVSPSADTEKNYNTLYADVKLWCESHLIDAVIPQLYFGFDYPDEKYSFERLLVEWLNFTAYSDVSVYIGLAPYKLGTSQIPDRDEWENGTEVVSNQIKNIFTRPEINGIVLFSYSHLFGDGELKKEQLGNISKVLNDLK